ncbi:MAG: LysR substrate-binding domain-containing protein [Archangium sp.]
MPAINSKLIIQRAAIVCSLVKVHARSSGASQFEKFDSFQQTHRFRTTMPSLPELDLHVLRTLVAADQLGSFSRAAARVGRSQSAVSHQIRRVEEQLGDRLFEKHGRGLRATDAGSTLLSYARRMLALNDEAVLAVRGRSLEGVARFGLPADFAEAWLPAALGQFRRANPGVRIEAVVDRNRVLLEQLDRGELDLVLALGNASRRDAELAARLPYCWVGPADARLVALDQGPVPLVAFEAPCFFRQRAQTALERAGMNSRVAFISPSLHGLWAAIEAGLGITLRTSVGLPRALEVLVDRRLPSLKSASVEVCLHDGNRQLAPALIGLRECVLDVLAQKLPAAFQVRKRRSGRTPRT